jgi:hypothetical protein
MNCKKLQDDLTNFRAQVRSLQYELNHTNPRPKQSIVSEIKALQKRIVHTEHELDNCMGRHPLPTIAPLDTTFSGTYTISSDNNAVKDQFFTAPISANFHFNGLRTTIEISSLNIDPVGPFPTPALGKDATDTITPYLNGTTASGSFDKATGIMSINLKLKIHHSISNSILGIQIEGSDLNIVLVTGTIGSLEGHPLDTTSHSITLVGYSNFTGGYLGGSRASLTITGTFLVLP